MMLGGGTSIQTKMSETGGYGQPAISLSELKMGRLPPTSTAISNVTANQFFSASKLLILKSFGSGFIVRSML